MSGIRQLNGNLYEYLERFNKIYATFPNHQINEQLIIQYCYKGFFYQRREMLLMEQVEEHYWIRRQQELVT